MKGNYNETPMWLSGNQLPPSMAISSETNLKKKGTLKQKKESQRIIPSMAKNEKVDSNIEIENTSGDFNTLNYPAESTIRHNI